MQDHVITKVERIPGVDVARGLAILAAIAVWFLNSEGTLTSDPSSWHLTLSGRVLVLFALVAGVSVGLLNGGIVVPEGTAATQDRVRLMVRAVAVFAVGHAVNVVDVPFANTLSMFGMLIAIAILFLRRSPLQLLVIAAAWIALLPMMVTTWGWLSGHAWFSGWSALGGYLLFGEAPLLRYIPVVLIGLALARLNLRRTEVQRRMLLGGLALMLIGGISSLPGSGTLATALNGADDRALTIVESSYPDPGEVTDKQEDSGKATYEDDAVGLLTHTDSINDVDLTGKTCLLMDQFFIQCFGSEAEAEEMKILYQDMFSGEMEETGAQDTGPSGWLHSWHQEGGWSGYRTLVTEAGIAIGAALVVLAISLLVGSRGWPVAALGSIPVTAYAALALLGKAISLPLAGSWVLAVAVASIVIASLWSRLVGRGPLEAAIHAISMRAASIRGASSAEGARSRDRVIGLDVARGLALLGMAAVHMVPGLPFISWSPDTWAGIASGRSSILFAVLAGVSMAIMSGRNHPYTGEKLLQARSRILTRALIIFTIGLVLGAFSHPVAVILDYYGIFFVIALPFLTWKPRNLFIGAGILAVVVPFVNYFITDWAGGEVTDELFTYMFGGIYPAFVWLALMLFGMGIGRLNLSSLHVQRRLLAASLFLVVLGWGTGEWAEHVSGNQELQDQMTEAMAQIANIDSNTLDLQMLKGEEIETSDWACSEYVPGQISCTANSFMEKFGDVESQGLWEALGTWSPHSGTTFDLVGSGGFAALVIALCLLASRKVAWLLTPLSAIGTTALTAYVAHVLMLAFWKDTPDGQWTLWLIFIGVAIPASMLWKRFLGRGPLERALSWMAYRNSAIRVSQSV